MAREVIGEFGYDRVNHVLSNTLQQLKSDGRFSRENKEWAKKAYIPVDKVGLSDRRKDFVVNKSHPAVLDGFINLVRKEYQNLALWESKHCNESTSLNFEGKIMVLHPSTLKDQFKNNRDQLVYCQNGFGCSPTSSGRKVFGMFISDSEKCQYVRNDFIGELKEEHHSPWLKERLEQMDIEYVNLATKENTLLESILDTLTAEEQEDFLVLCEERPDKTTAFAINMALAVKNEQYTIYRDVEDKEEIGQRYVEEEHSGLDLIISSNLDFEGIGINLVESYGKMTDVGFVVNYDISPEELYKPSEIDNLLEKYEVKPEQIQTQSQRM